MKIVLATCGSRGDVQPMIALCLALNAAGHDTLLIGPPEKALWAQQMGCSYMAFGRDVTEFINQLDNTASLTMARAALFFVRQEIKTQFKVLPNLIKGADLIIGSSLMFGLSSIAQALNIPYRYIAFTPQIFPSSHHPFVALKTQTMPEWANTISWKTATFLDWFNTTHLVNRYRKKMGLNSLTNSWDHIFGEKPIVACDKEVAPVPEDVQKKPIQTGYLHLTIPKPNQPDLDRFLEQGPKPIYAGFGSMPPKEQHQNIPLLIDSARQLGHRMIIAKFWDSPAQDPKGDDIFFLKTYPHFHLFPKMAAVIHHGGAGTTACAALSGVPQIIVPHILDQFFHGQKIYAAGLGPKPIWRSKFTRDKLIPALDECISNIKIKQTAQTVGLKIDPDHSMQKTIQAIERPV